MKKIFVLIFCLLFAANIFAQSVGINNDGSSPDGSAMLDVKSTTKGLLPPRVTSTANVTSPATGLLVYQTGSPAGYYYYNGTIWVKIYGGAETDPVFTASSAFNITGSNITNWNTAFSWGDHAGLYRSVTWVPTWSDISGNPFHWSSPANGDLMRYDLSTQHWENFAPDYLTSFTETDPFFTANFDVSSSTTGDLLKFAGTKFVKFTPNFTESNYLYNTKYGIKLLARNDAQTNVDFVLSPKGNGGIIAQQPDGTTTGGNNRGIYSVDLQRYRTTATQVASGDNSTLSGGRYNTASGSSSTVSGGGGNTANAVCSVVTGGAANTASGKYSITLGGWYNFSTGDHSVASGYLNTAPSYGETVFGLMATQYTPNSSEIFNSNDRLFTIGNGEYSNQRSNALVILKNANTTIGGSLTLNGNGTDVSYTFPIDRGTSGQVLATDSSGVTSWATPYTGLTNFTESNYLFNTKYGAKLLARNDAQPDVDFVISPKGSGAILAQQPDGTAIGGDNRGTAAVDLQLSRGLSSQVASGSFSVIAGGYWNEASSNHATVGGGSNNTAFGSYSCIPGGKTNTANGFASLAFGANNEANGMISTASGNYNTTDGDYSFAAGLHNFANDYMESVFGQYATLGYGSTNSWVATDRLFTLGNGTAAAGNLRSNALTILKNGNTTIGGSLTLNGNGSGISYTFPIDRGTNGQVLKTNANGTTTWSSAEEPGTQTGQMKYWNGTAWVIVSTGLTGQLLTINSSGIPEWQNPSSIKSAYTTAVTAGASGVTFNGVVNANGLSTVVAFEYGATTSYGNSVTAIQSPVNNSVNYAVSSSLVSGFTIGTEYHARIVTQNIFGTFYGNDITFYSAYIGASSQGGIIAYFLQPGDPGYDANVQHGLIVAPSDQSTSAEWGCYDSPIAGADGTAIGTGNQNTIDIIAGCTQTGIAAKLCSDLILNGYNDWYLPSKDELNKLYLNRIAIGGLASDYYWSSTEYPDNHFAWSQNLSNGETFPPRKDDNHYYVRAVRSF